MRHDDARCCSAARSVGESSFCVKPGLSSSHVEATATQMYPEDARGRGPAEVGIEIVVRGRSFLSIAMYCYVCRAFMLLLGDALCEAQWSAVPEQYPAARESISTDIHRICGIWGQDK